MKLKLNTMFDVIAREIVKKGPVPFLEGVIVRIRRMAKPVAISLRLLRHFVPRNDSRVFFRVSSAFSSASVPRRFRGLFRVCFAVFLITSVPIIFVPIVFVSFCPKTDYVE